jgi:hypothetical protein
MDKGLQAIGLFLQPFFYLVSWPVGYSIVGSHLAPIHFTQSASILPSLTISFIAQFTETMRVLSCGKAKPSNSPLVI